MPNEIAAWRRDRGAGCTRCPHCPTPHRDADGIQRSPCRSCTHSVLFLDSFLCLCPARTAYAETDTPSATPAGC